MALSGAGQACWHRPHPSQSAASTRGIPSGLQVSAPSTGQRSTQVTQPVLAIHLDSFKLAVPMARGADTDSAPGAHALMQGAGSHM
jgi:hypothetical protein